MNKFMYCMAFTGAWEGGFVDDPKDPGGATKYGISLRFLKDIGPELGDIDKDDDVDADDIFLLTKEQAEALYKAKFWDPFELDNWDVVLGLPLFDTAVNMGRSKAVRICQRTFNALGCRIDVDGIWGSQTRQAASEVLFTARKQFGDKFCLNRIEAYSELVTSNKNLARFLLGWINRTVALANEIRKSLV